MSAHRLLSVASICLFSVALTLVAATGFDRSGDAALAEASLSDQAAAAAGKARDASGKADFMAFGMVEFARDCDRVKFYKALRHYSAAMDDATTAAAAARAALAKAKAAGTASNAASVEATLAKAEATMLANEEEAAKAFKLLDECPKVVNAVNPEPSPTPTPIIITNPFPLFSTAPITLVSPTPTPRPVPSGIQPGQTYSRYGVSPTPEISAPVPPGRTYSRPGVSPTPTSGGSLRNARTASLSRDDQIAPAPGSGTGTELAQFLPPIAGPGAVVFGTSSSQNEAAGPQSVVVGTSDAQGHQNFFQLATNAAGQFAFLVPAGASGLTAFRHFDKSGQPDAGATCQVVNGPAHIPNTQSLPNAPPSGPAIIEADSAYEMGGQGQGIIQLQTRGLDPLNAQVFVDGSAANIVTKAASDKSVVAQMNGGMPLGLHEFVVKSGNQRTNSFHAAVVTLNFQGLPKMHPGGEYPVLLNITGVPNQVAGRVRFDVLGAATFADGSKTTTVTVNNGVAASSIRVLGVGAVRLAAQLTLDLPDFRSKP